MISKPLSIIYNAHSGSHSEKQTQTFERIVALFEKNGFKVKLFQLTPEINLTDIMAQVLQRHQSPHYGVIVAAGGDGTINAVASSLVDTAIPMGILPLGTFNYVARQYEIPLEIEKAAQVIVNGSSHLIHVATVNQRIYLNNASLGLYPLFIQKREQYNRRFGRFMLNAYLSSLAVLIRHWQALHLKVTIDQQQHHLKTPLIFFGHNSLQLEELRLNITQAPMQGKVAGVIFTQKHFLSIWQMIIQFIRRDLERAKDVTSFTADHVMVQVKSRKLLVAIDGELEQLETPLRFAVKRNALYLVVP